jgi:hypothetical protein
MLIPLISSSALRPAMLIWESSNKIVINDTLRTATLKTLAQQLE